MKYRLIAAWYCLLGRGVIYNIIFQDVVRIDPQKTSHIIRSRFKDGLKLHIPDEAQYEASNIIPFPKNK